MHGNTLIQKQFSYFTAFAAYQHLKNEGQALSAIAGYLIIMVSKNTLAITMGFTHQSKIVLLVAYKKTSCRQDGSQYLQSLRSQPHIQDLTREDI